MSAPAGVAATGEPGPELIEDRLVRGARRAVTRAGRALGAYLPARRLALVLAALAPVWLLSSSPSGAGVATIAVVSIALAITVDVLTIPARGLVRAEWRLPPQVGAGDSVSGACVIRSRARRSLRVRVFDRPPRGIAIVREGPAAGDGTTEFVLPPAGEIVVPLTLRGLERGRWTAGPLALRTVGRLGLVQRTYRWDPEDAVLVVPSMTGVRRYRLLAMHHRLRDAGVRTIRRRGESTNFSQLREYVVGDDPRRIDWKATVRRDKLITREYTVEQGQTVMIAIDAGRMMTQLAGGLPRFEYALSSAMLLADVAVQSRDEVGLLLFNDQVRAFVPPLRGRQALERVRQALVPAVPTMTEPDYALAFRVLGERHRKRSLVVLFTDVVDARASQALIAHTTRSAARHLLVVIALRNDRLIQAAIPTAASSSTQLFESAAAEELVAAREDALVRMRRSGISVVDVPPEAMAMAVINRYLEVKARASL